MRTHKINLFFLICVMLVTISCNNAQSDGSSEKKSDIKKEVAKEIPVEKIITGAERTGEYLKLLEGKKVGVMGNQTSMIGAVHLVDSLVAAKINVVKIFSPEHGFRGKADAGESVSNYTDEKTGIQVISLYGNTKKASPADLKDIELMVFDMQDVGARFYTYISSLHYMMEACAENNIPMILLDRPNPNGHYVDGPVLDMKFTSFVGMHPVPIVHGMTIGEYAQMINGEKWLKNGIQCALTVITCENYDHSKIYELPVKPSPNLPNFRAVNLYPSLCLFEATTLSIGRGTDMQFQVIGHPLLKGLGDKDFSFTPKSNEGAKTPVLQGKQCFGYDLRTFPDSSELISEIRIEYLIDIYKAFPSKTKFFLKDNLFEKLAGNDVLRKQIIEGKTAEEIRATWKDGLEKFKKIREKYLLY
ncbi:MAG: hypothetical protein A2W91_15870 [Bacteroidetes bacterium GWF2_38_335]|nr:MAG: hypothetical protein A2W91_15870 [Bacteroidetes bacterium GWF2_38_335]OFY81432.1 MAG: hypothetical protein A2281_06845 [Bacteroidetes bacterium RIFOXYA12_FULL_38_20]HBS85282.1 DUF1343 domain-containing protein [Bacteroidales bacterium]